MAKRLELLREALPKMRRVAYLTNPSHQGSEPTFRALEIAAKSLKLEVQAFEVRGPNDFESAFSAMAKSHIDALVMHEQPLFLVNTQAIVKLAAKHRLPSGGYTEFAEAGGLIGYGVDFMALNRRAAYFIDRILKGAKPSDLPVEQPTRFEMVINMKTAKALGITIPNSILVRATKVIK
jgi:putative ABC transport system substrate-binding protein